MRRRSGFRIECNDSSATLLDPTGVPIPGYHQGRSLLPVLEGKGEGTRVRESVRCEYFDALDPYFTGGDGSFGTMYRTERYKLSIYHDKNLGELYDLELDPWEFENLWDDAEYAVLKNRLILESFNSHVNLTTDVGSKRIAPM